MPKIYQVQETAMRVSRRKLLRALAWGVGSAILCPARVCLAQRERRVRPKVSPECGAIPAMIPYKICDA